MIPQTRYRKGLLEVPKANTKEHFLIFQFKLVKNFSSLFGICHVQHHSLTRNSDIPKIFLKTVHLCFLSVIFHNVLNQGVWCLRRCSANSKTPNDLLIENSVNESALGLFKAYILQAHGGNEEKTKTLIQNSRGPEEDSKPAPLKYKSEALR